MVILSFKTKKDKEHLLKKAKEMEAYASDLVECLEEAKASGDYEDEYDDEYAERGYRRTSMRGGRYGYRG